MNSKKRVESFFKQLETKRLFLKNISPEDRDFVFSLFSNEDVNTFLFDAEPVENIQGADEIIAYYTMPEPRSMHRWILVRKEDGAKLGTCGFHCWNKETGECDVGYDLYPDYWGKGYMSEALAAILQFAKNEMKVSKVNACIYSENKPSLKLAEKLGFSFVGQMKNEVFRGEEYPHMILTLRWE